MKIFLLFLIYTLFISLTSCAVRFSKTVSPAPQKETIKKSYRYTDSDLTKDVQKWLGTPYLYGGTDRYGIDCSALSGKIYKNVYQYKLPRTALEQMRLGKRVSPSLLKPGDLIFFKSKSGKVADHVGIYLGNDQFVHASRKKGVTISRFSSNYYQKHFAQSRRLLR